MIEAFGVAFTVLVIGLAIARKMPLVLALLVACLPVLRIGSMELDACRWKCMALAAVVVAVMVTARSRRTWLSSLAVPLVLLDLLITLFSYVLCQDPEVATDAVCIAMQNTALFLAIISCSGSKTIRGCLAATSVLLALVGTIAVSQFAVIHFRVAAPWLQALLPVETRMYFFEMVGQVDERGIRLSSVFRHSNELGHFLALTAAMCLSLAMHVRSRGTAALHAVLASFAVGCALLTLSRGAVLLVGLEMSVIIAVGWRAFAQRARMLVAVGALVVGGGAFLLHNNLVAFVDRLATTNLSHRDVNWQHAASLIPESGFFGIGPGCSSTAILREFPPIDEMSLLISHYARTPFEPSVSNAHNFYLASILETGFLSLLVKLVLFGGFAYYGTRSLCGGSLGIMRALVLAATVTLAAEFVRGVFEAYNFLSAPETGAHIALCMGVITWASARGTSVPRHAPRRS